MTHPTNAMELMLLPCPFCGEKSDFYPLDRRIPYRIKCGTCDGESGAGSSLQMAVKLWNTRTQPSADNVEAYRCGMHEPYQVRCVHCDIEFKNGAPVKILPSEKAEQ